MTFVKPSILPTDYVQSVMNGRTKRLYCPEQYGAVDLHNGDAVLYNVHFLSRSTFMRKCYEKCSYKFSSQHTDSPLPSELYVSTSILA